MAERPIIFSAPMVRAILAGTKTQTRRIATSGLWGSAPREYAAHADFDLAWIDGSADSWYLHVPCHASANGECKVCDHWGWPSTTHRLWPRYHVGDTLWVRHAASLFDVYYKPIPGWEGKYAAGTDGLIYRMDRGEPSVLKGSPTSRGYLTVSLSDGAWKTFAVHKLVAETFYGRHEGEVRHMDGCRTNNLPANLDYGSSSDNWDDRRSAGRGVRADHHAAKLSEEQVAAIRASSKSQRALAREYGVTQATIWRIKSGAGWKEAAEPKRNLPAFKLWKPSIHMPRWASRITLRVTSVRVERLQEISEADAAAEGVELNHYYCDPDDGEFGTHRCDPRGKFRELWDSINAEREPWSSNPWVWVIGFERIKP